MENYLLKENRINKDGNPSSRSEILKLAESDLEDDWKLVEGSYDPEFDQNQLQFLNAYTAVGQVGRGMKKSYASIESTEVLKARKMISAIYKYFMLRPEVITEVISIALSATLSRTEVHTKLTGYASDVTNAYCTLPLINLLLRMRYNLLLVQRCNSFSRMNSSFPPIDSDHVFELTSDSLASLNEEMAEEKKREVIHNMRHTAELGHFHFNVGKVQPLLISLHDVTLINPEKFNPIGSQIEDKSEIGPQTEINDPSVASIDEPLISGLVNEMLDKVVGMSVEPSSEHKDVPMTFVIMDGNGNAINEWENYYTTPMETFLKKANGGHYFINDTNPVHFTAVLMEIICSHLNIPIFMTYGEKFHVEPTFDKAAFNLNFQNFVNGDIIETITTTPLKEGSHAVKLKIDIKIAKKVTPYGDFIVLGHRSKPLLYKGMMGNRYVEAAFEKALCQTFSEEMSAIEQFGTTSLLNKVRGLPYVGLTEPINPKKLKSRLYDMNTLPVINDKVTCPLLTTYDNITTPGVRLICSGSLTPNLYSFQRVAITSDALYRNITSTSLRSVAIADRCILINNTVIIHVSTDDKDEAFLNGESITNLLSHPESAITNRFGYVGPVSSIEPYVDIRLGLAAITPKPVNRNVVITTVYDYLTPRPIPKTVQYELIGSTKINSYYIGRLHDCDQLLHKGKVVFPSTNWKQSLYKDKLEQMEDITSHHMNLLLGKMVEPLNVTVNKCAALYRYCDRQPLGYEISNSHDEAMQQGINIEVMIGSGVFFIKDVLKTPTSSEHGEVEPFKRSKIGRTNVPFWGPSNIIRVIDSTKKISSQKMVGMLVDDFTPPLITQKDIDLTSLLSLKDVEASTEALHTNKKLVRLYDTLQLQL